MRVWRVEVLFNYYDQTGKWSVWRHGLIDEFRRRQLPKSPKRAFTLLKRTRSGPKPLSDAPRPWPLPARLKLSATLSRSRTPGTSSPWSSSPAAPKVPSRLLKTETHSCSSSTNAPPSQWSRRLASSFTQSRSRRSTPWSLPAVRRRLMLSYLQSTTPLRSPTRSALCEHIPHSKLTLNCTWCGWEELDQCTRPTAMRRIGKSHC